MNYLAYHESKMRGTFDFPIELHYVDPAHPRYLMPFHWHLEYELILVLQGSFALSLDSETLLLQQGDAALVPDSVIHGGTPSNCIYECIVFDLNRFLREHSTCQNVFDKLLTHARLQNYFPRSSNACQIVDALFEVMEKEPAGYEFTTTGLLWQLMGTILRERLYTPGSQVSSRDRKRRNQMKKALALIRRGYAVSLSLADLAAEAGIDPKYFCRVFFEATGRTPIDYLNYYRVECAGEMLLVTDESITDIALSCGFNDLSYFTKTFRKYKGVSARQFRGGKPPLF